MAALRTSLRMTRLALAEAREGREVAEVAVAANAAAAQRALERARSQRRSMALELESVRALLRASVGATPRSGHAAPAASPGHRASRASLTRAEPRPNVRGFASLTVGSFRGPPLSSRALPAKSASARQSPQASRTGGSRDRPGSENPALSRSGPAAAAASAREGEHQCGNAQASPDAPMAEDSDAVVDRLVRAAERWLLPADTSNATLATEATVPRSPGVLRAMAASEVVRQMPDVLDAARRELLALSAHSARLSTHNERVTARCASLERHAVTVLRGSESAVLSANAGRLPSP